MRLLPIFVFFTCGHTLAAPVATLLEPVADLTQESVQKTEQQTQKQPENTEPHIISLSSQELLQQPQTLHNALDTAVEQQNIRAIRLLLPLYRQLDEQDPVLTQYAQALLLRADGRYPEALAAFRNLLQQHPDYAPVRLQYAQTLSQDNQTKEARRELKNLQQPPDLPEPVQQYLAQFDEHLNREQKWQFNTNAYYLSDKNINQAPNQREYAGWRFEAPKSAHGIGYEFSAQKTQPIAGHWAARGTASVYGKSYWDAHDYDDQIARTEAGIVWRNHNQEISVQPYYEKRWYGNEPYSHTTGVALRYSRTLSPKSRLFAAWQSGYKKHDKREFLNGATHLGSLSFLYRTSSEQYFVFGLGGGYESAHDKSDAYTHNNVRFSWTRNWAALKQLETTFSTTVQQRHYRAPDFFNIKRHDTEYFTRLSVSYPKFSWHGFVPRLNWTWSHTRSNHFYYRQTESHVLLDVSKQF